MASNLSVLSFVVFWNVKSPISVTDAGTEIDVTLRREAHAAVLSVANESEEIPPEKLAHLFDRFYRADEARTGEDFHYGLGLSIAKAAAEKHGGSINASCPAGKVIFTVSLPLKK